MICNKCGFERGTAFYQGRKACKICIDAKNRSWAKNNKDRARISSVKRTLRWQAKNPINTIFIRCRTYDRKRGYDTCSLKEFELVINGQSCYVCWTTECIGADRINNKKGHELNNIVPCCGDCNRTRGDRYSYEEMRDTIGPAIREINKKRPVQVVQVLESIGYNREIPIWP